MVLGCSISWCLGWNRVMDPNSIPILASFHRAVKSSKNTPIIRDSICLCFQLPKTSPSLGQGKHMNENIWPQKVPKFRASNMLEKPMENLPIIANPSCNKLPWGRHLQKCIQCCRWAGGSPNLVLGCHGKVRGFEVRSALDFGKKTSGWKSLVAWVRYSKIDTCSPFERTWLVPVSHPSYWFSTTNPKQRKAIKWFIPRELPLLNSFQTSHVPTHIETKINCHLWKSVYSV